jgi:hypothetical protein
MESTDTNVGMNSLAVDGITDVRKSQTSLISANSDDPSFQINEVSNCQTNSSDRKKNTIRNFII